MRSSRPLAGLFILLALAVAISAKVHFFEPFDEPFGSTWSQSEDPSYEGNWKYQKSEGSEDFGLFIPDKAKKYGIARLLDEQVDLSKGTVVLQYDVRLQKGYDCGGAYLKFLMPQPEGFKAGDFKDATPYSIMFGPDKCGATNKVHFIFRHKSPKTQEYVEHHLEKTPLPKTEWVSHVYTAVVSPSNNSVKILVDGEEEAFGELLSHKDFKPSVLPPKTIKDPEDKKPEDWDERPKIPDPEAQKPEDWDEDAPKEIPDEDAQKPEGWLDDEPLEVDDPEAQKPEDWDDSEDGEWEPPKVANPKCEEGPGCGEWKRPTKKNPNFKGKWRAPMIENPSYKGKWSPRDIPNPDYFEIEQAELQPITGVGIEIWTMTNEVIFDNILITDSEEEAAEHRSKYWKPKYDKEKALKEEQSKKEAEERKKEPKVSFKDKIFGKLHELADSDLLQKYKLNLHPIITKVEDNEYFQYAAIGALALVPLLFLLCLCLPRGRGTRTPVAVPVEVAKKQDVSEPDDAAAEKEAEEPAEAKATESKEEEADGTEEKVRRRPRRDS